MGRAKTQYATMNAQTCTYTHRCECLREEFESRALTFKRPTESLGQPASRHDCTTESSMKRESMEMVFMLLLTGLGHTTTASSALHATHFCSSTYSRRSL